MNLYRIICDGQQSFSYLVVAEDPQDAERHMSIYHNLGERNWRIAMQQSYHVSEFEFVEVDVDVILTKMHVDGTSETMQVWEWIEHTPKGGLIMDTNW